MRRDNTASPQGRGVCLPRGHWAGQLYERYVLAGNSAFPVQRSRLEVAFTLGDLGRPDRPPGGIRHTNKEKFKWH